MAKQSTEVEVMELDLRYEDQRMRSASTERRLLLSIMDEGIRDPLLGACLAAGERVLLDGFKRLRCARKLGLKRVPFLCIGEDEATAIIKVLRLSQARALSLLEQAVFVEALKSLHGLSVSEIAKRLERSKAWVSVRLSTLAQMGEKTKSMVLSGSFPLYSYLYTLHPFRRLNNSENRPLIEEFVGLCSGKSLTTRDIEHLAQGFFRGSPEMREQIQKGDLAWCLAEMKERDTVAQSSSLTETETRVVSRCRETLKSCTVAVFLSLVLRTSLITSFRVRLT